MKFRRNWQEAVWNYTRSSLLDFDFWGLDFPFPPSFLCSGRIRLLPATPACITQISFGLPIGFSLEFVQKLVS